MPSYLQEKRKKKSKPRATQEKILDRNGLEKRLEEVKKEDDQVKYLASLGSAVLESATQDIIDMEKCIDRNNPYALNALIATKLKLQKSFYELAIMLRKK
ncbi:hypothetical protein PVA45_08680 (plasmid) [Entomospira entomophila]|uniref:Uncharacterized protein n=1 Tax=Entomospira entomophila TaxID=2719988 RepID=A0A968KTL6_9SPIO|nr:hypothetical protein [Entomospira entomophilus]NIZ41582.1 hypothetical protein [Entomospira entomophilus]WDI36478.1 hypothetical protein PVA45_08680 [Entomospira entomophilus]